MSRLLALAIALLVSCCQSLTALTQYQRQQSYLGNSDIQIRPATEADLDDITTVFIDAFAPGPVWRYLFPYLDQFKESVWNCTRETIGQQFADRPNTTFVNVISVADRHSTADEQGKRQDRVVAIAVWRIIEPTTELSHLASMDLLGVRPGSAKCSDHLEANETRALDYERQFSVAEKHYVLDFPHKQMYLGLLGTHPDWDGHGFGAAHCQWGVEMARGMGVPVTLIATPAGWPLYDSLEFESVANITIETLDEPENLWFEYMRYHTSEHEHV